MVRAGSLEFEDCTLSSNSISRKLLVEVMQTVSGVVNLPSVLRIAECEGVVTRRGRMPLGFTQRAELKAALLKKIKHELYLYIT